MHEALTLLAELNETDIAWIFDTATEQQVIANTVIIKEGTHPDSLFIVLEGLVGVELSLFGDLQLATLGPGELVGEISFLEKCPASATIKAVENSLLLALPRTKLEAKLQGDLGFAYRLHKSFALLATRRLRERVGLLGRRLRERPESERVASASWNRISNTIEAFKSILHKADQEALQNNGVVPPGFAEQVDGLFRQLCDLLNAEIGDQSPEDIHVREELGARVQREILPYLLLTRVSERVYSKPRGYAGDFLTIDWIYRNEAGGAGRLGPLIDRAGLNMRAAQAVRNRRNMLVEEILQVVEDKKPQPARVVSLACGPAQEVFDVFNQLKDPTWLKATLIDIDLSSLAFVADRRDQLKLKRQMDLVQGNLVYLATGRQHLNLKEQDLIYSIGLIDYFSDNFVVAMLNYIYEMLKPGGKVILGNFHPRNPDKAMMDYVLDWRLTHRNEEDMNRLYSTSRFARACTKIRFEAVGINLFAECIKESQSS
jgi:extracellular factor (EF) 3-hydroxypalmitic acid methyl ester biosynthesis protein